jgi:cobalt transporter subunit CbtB
MSKLAKTFLSQGIAVSTAKGGARTVAFVLPCLLGALIVYAMGFAPGRLHGTAHDSRHSVGLVCH